MNRWPLPEFSSSTQERNFVYNFEDDDDRNDYSSDDHRIDRMIRPVFRNDDPSKQQQQQLAADLAKSYSFHGDGAALVPSYVVTVSRSIQAKITSLILASFLRHFTSFRFSLFERRLRRFYVDLLASRLCCC